MAARGAVAKEQITNQILSQFEGAFKYDKEIRIPVMENGETIQIKVTLTAAKTNVERGGDTALPGDTVSTVAPTSTPSALAEPTTEEKERVSNLLSKLGLQLKRRWEHGSFDAIFRMEITKRSLVL